MAGRELGYIVLESAKLVVNSGLRSTRARQRLADVMGTHVFDTLARADGIGLIVCLSPVPTNGLRDGMVSRSLSGTERGATRAPPRCSRSATHHTRRPAARVARRCRSANWAAGRSALAPDRHSAATNAIALLPCQPLEFAFGISSFFAHAATMPVARSSSALALAWTSTSPMTSKRCARSASLGRKMLGRGQRVRPNAKTPEGEQHHGDDRTQALRDPPRRLGWLF